MRVSSLGCSLWLDPMVKRSHLPAINVTINETSIRSQLLQSDLATENPQVSLYKHLHIIQFFHGDFTLFDVTDSLQVFPVRSGCVKALKT